MSQIARPVTILCLVEIAKRVCAMFCFVCGLGGEMPNRVGERSLLWSWQRGAETTEAPGPASRMGCI
jgi:hypothetical protein